MKRRQLFKSLFSGFATLVGAKSVAAPRGPGTRIWDAVISNPECFELPVVEFEITSVPVLATARKLRGKWESTSAVLPNGCVEYTLHAVDDEAKSVFEKGARLCENVVSVSRTAHADV